MRSVPELNDVVVLPSGRRAMVRALLRAPDEPLRLRCRYLARATPADPERDVTVPATLVRVVVAGREQPEPVRVP